MRSRWSAGLNILAVARNAVHEVSAPSVNPSQVHGSQSKGYAPLWRQTLQRSTPVSSATPSSDCDPEWSPLNGSDFGSFLRELDALRERMNEAANWRQTSQARAILVNEALTGAVRLLAGKRASS